jgi:hypothetical protein
MNITAAVNAMKYADSKDSLKQGSPLKTGSDTSSMPDSMNHTGVGFLNDFVSSPYHL